MEQIYRRYNDRTHTRKQNKAPIMRGYKQKIIRQSLFCLLLFLLCLFAKNTPLTQLEIVRNSIQLILNTHTDFASMPKTVQNFLQEHILQNSADALQGKDVLASLVPPTNAVMTSPFGLRAHPSDGTEKFHYGVDLGATEGEKIKCAASGNAVEVGTNDEYGNYILVQHPDEIYTLYAHCQTILPAQGDEIQAGQVIATAGATGNATGPHLHFELRNGETYLDPSAFIQFKQGENHD